MSTHPDITVAVRSLLQADADITTAVASQIFVNRMPQGIAGSSIVLWSISETPFNHLGGAMGTDQALIQVECYGASPEPANEIAWLTWMAIDATGIGTWSGVEIIGAARNSGVRNATDSPSVGTDQYRYIASQDFRFTYRSLVKV